MITVIQQVIWPERRRTRWRFERDGVGVEGLRVWRLKHDDIPEGVERDGAPEQNEDSETWHFLSRSSPLATLHQARYQAPVYLPLIVSCEMMPH